jgi:DNA-directed RNA polymerase subunit L
MENLTTTLNGYRLDCEFKNVPIAFVNALRRIVLADIPTVILNNIQILENTSSMTNEMLQHRISQIPVNVRPDETGVIRDTVVEIRFLSGTESDRQITTDDFDIAGPRKDILLRDRDLGTPLLFMNLKKNESLRVRACLSIDSKNVSQVCVSTFKNHIDPKRAALDRDTWVAEGNDGRIFDAFHIQRSYSVDDNGRPNWFDFAIESIGVMPAKDILRKALEILQARIVEFAKVDILREEPGWYRMEMPGETFTLGELVQKMMYEQSLVDFVSRDVGHPLIPKLIVRFNTKSPPETVVERFKTEALALCESVLKSV